MPRARNFFMGLGTGLTDQLDQQQKIKQIFAAALAQEQAKAQFDPEMQAKQQLLQMANQAGQIPGQLQPASSAMPGAGASVLQGQAPSAGAANVGAFQQAQQQAQQKRQAILQLLMGRSGSQPGITFQMTPQGAQPITTPTGQTVSTRDRVLPASQTPKTAEQMTQESAAKETGKLQATQKQLSTRFNSGLDVIQRQLDALNPLVGQKMQQSNVAATGEAAFRRRLGATDPDFLRTKDAIDAQLGLFAQAVEGVPGGRAAQGIMQHMSGLMTNMLYLPPSEQAKNMRTLRDLAKEVNTTLASASGASSSGRQAGRFTIESD